MVTFNRFIYHIRKTFSVTAFSVLFFINPLSAYITENVHIVVIDGARYSETFGDPNHRYIPFIWNKLRPHATIFTRYYNDSITFTAPSHASIISGVWQNIPNDDSQQPNVPTLFEYYRKSRHTDSTQNYVILGKYKLHTLSYSTHPQYGYQYGASVAYSTSQYSDTIAWQNFRSVLTKFHPKLTITNLGQTDYCGHNYTWNDYTSAIHFADSIVNEMWNLVQNDSVYKNKTTFIVINDHGRHLTDWTSHGDGCDGCRHIMMMIIGPDTKEGVVDSVHHSHIDIAPTVAELLDFPSPYCTGTPLISMQLPNAPLLAVPSNNISGQTQFITLSWNPVNRASLYQVQISLSQSFNKIINDTTLENHSIETEKLSLNTIYYWRVRSINRAGSGAWSEIRNFKTTPFSPPEIAIVSPENNAIISSDSVNFKWKIIANKADYYYLQIASDSLMKNIIFVDSSIISQNLLYLFTFKQGTFWWRIKPHYSAGWAGWSQTQKVTVDFKDSKQKFHLNLGIIYNKYRSLQLNFSFPSASNVKIGLYSIKGDLVKEIYQNLNNSTAYNITIKDLHIAKGYYLLKLKAGQFLEKRRFIVY